MPLSDKLRFVRAGIDIPSASQQNTIVRILKEHGYYRGPIQPPDDAVRIIDNWTAYEVVQIDDIVSIARKAIAYDTKTFSAPNSDNFDILICDGATGWASFGFRPIMAKVAGASFPSIGAMLGPKHGESELYASYPGFRFLGESPIDNVGWVIRDRGIATGQGEVITSSGQTGTPDNFELEAVKFSSGFDGWDHTSDLTVVNTFSDEASAGMLVQFKWDAYSGAYISTDVECV
jgi:hypothetical protein